MTAGVGEGTENVANQGAKADEFGCRLGKSSKSGLHALKALDLEYKLSRIECLELKSLVSVLPAEV